MKTIIASLAVLFIFNLNAQEISLAKLIDFKSKNLNQVANQITLNGWDFHSQDNTGNLFLEKSIIYKFTDNRGFKSYLYAEKYKGREEIEVWITTENKNYYLSLLKQAMSIGFNISNSNTQVGSLRLEKYKIGERMLLTNQSTRQEYSNGKYNLTFGIYKYTTVLNNYNGQYSYNPNDIEIEYSIYVSRKM